MKKAIKISFLVLGSVIVAAILFGVIYIAAGIDFPPLKGPYKVGKTFYDVVDKSRTEIFSKNAEDKRELLLTIYYPASPAANAKPSPFIAGKLGEVMAKQTGIPRFILDSIHAQSYDEAPAARDKAPYPVLLFSQGMNGQLPPYGSLLEEVASQGYVIVCVSHQYSDTFVVYPDGRTVYANEAGMGYDTQYADRKTFEQRLDKVMDVWTDDTIFAINQLDEINKSHNILANTMDLTNIGIFGHSFGGAAAANTMMRDNRLKAGVNLDGAIYGELKAKGVRQPYFVMASESLGAFWFAMSGDLQKIIENSEVCYAMGIRGTGHITFVTDVPFIAKKFSLLIHMDTGNIDPNKSYAIITDYTVQFFNQQLKGIHSSLLEEINPMTRDSFRKKQTYPEVTIQKYSRSNIQGETGTH